MVPGDLVRAERVRDGWGGPEGRIMPATTTLLELFRDGIGPGNLNRAPTRAERLTTRRGSFSMRV